jgi:transcriptional regulator with XRE-family HTH domain
VKKAPQKKVAIAPRKASPTMTVEPFGSNVRRKRIAKEMSQHELARLAGISQARIPAIELGRVDVHLSSARKLAAALGVPLRDLL